MREKEKKIGEKNPRSKEGKKTNPWKRKKEVEMRQEDWVEKLRWCGRSCQLTTLKLQGLRYFFGTHSEYQKKADQSKSGGWASKNKGGASPRARRVLVNYPRQRWGSLS